MQTTKIGEEDNPTILTREFSDTKKPNSFQVTSLLDSRRLIPILFITSILLFIGCVFLGVRLSGNVTKVKALEEVTTKNTRQLANLNELLGRTLDTNKEEVGALPSVNLKLSLEFFKHLNELLASVDALTFINIQSTTNIEKPNAVEPVLEKSTQSTNAEIRWWSGFFKQFLTPIKTYFTELVHVQVIDSPVTELAISQASQTLMKQEVKLRLLTIRQLVLNGLAHEAVMETKNLHALSSKNFNLMDESVKKFIAKLDQLVIELEKIKNGVQPNQKTMKEN
jgi:hypothetical protein